MPAINNFKITTPTTIVIFGATGDLSKRKLLPAIFDLHRRGALPKKFRVVGFSHSGMSQDEFLGLIDKQLHQHKHRHRRREIHSFLKLFSYQQGDFKNRADFKQLAQTLAGIDREFAVCANKLFHLAVPPQYYRALLTNLSHSGLAIPCSGKDSGWTRVLVEKPFGRDTTSARRLDTLLTRLFTESQIFRIDHYLAKETVRNVLAFRFSNALFEPLWSREHVERVELELMEHKDVAHRIHFYEGVGALRDMGQSHAMQLLSLVAMEQPASMDPEIIRRNRARVMAALRPLQQRHIRTAAVRAQYRGYALEKDNRRHSQTETYFQLRTELTNKRWRGVPFYITVGKALDKEKVKIKVFFKPSVNCFACASRLRSGPLRLSDSEASEAGPSGRHEHPQNFLVFRIQPQEGIAVHFWAKKPGLGMELVEKEISFDYAEFGAAREALPGAYETLLYDAMRGDQTNFASSEELRYSWRYVTNVLKLWRKIPLQTYAKGSGGPRHRLLKS